MTTYSIPESYPTSDEDIAAALAWATENGLDGNRIVRSTFKVTPGIDGSWWATGHLFDLDEHGKPIFLAGAATFSRTPFTVQVNSLPPFVSAEVAR